MSEACPDLSQLARDYKRRRPVDTGLYHVIQEHHESFVALSEEEDLPLLLGFVRREFERYLACGQLSEGCRSSVSPSTTT